VVITYFFICAPRPDIKPARNDGYERTGLGNRAHDVIPKPPAPGAQRAWRVHIPGMAGNS